MRVSWCAPLRKRYLGRGGSHVDVWARRIRVQGGSSWCKGPEVLGCTEEVWGEQEP